MVRFFKGRFAGVSLLAVVLVFQAPFLFGAEPSRTVVSPDGRAIFTVSLFPDHDELELRIGPRLAWRESTPPIDHIPAAWSSESRGLLMVDPVDRMSLKYLAIDGTQVHEYSVATITLRHLGERLVPFNWNLPNQGSIPHDNIFLLKTGLVPETFDGTYVRTRAPHQVKVPFQLTLSWRHGQCVPRFQARRPVEEPW